MKSFYNIQKAIEDVISTEPFNSTVKFGDISDIDLKKQSIFPLAHIIADSGTINQNDIVFNVTIYFIDLVEESEEQNSTNDAVFVQNTQLALASRIIRVLQKADLYRSDFEILGEVNFNLFKERFDNLLAGCEVTFSITTKTEMTYC
tara:strand:+ start:314 stop:754 length:441 start_codon:yes stop_codon:yes gene_type:complete